MMFLSVPPATEPNFVGGLNGSTRHFIFESKDGV
jgi:hypothetical protein